jgi:hypothetical protein
VCKKREIIRLLPPKWLGAAYKGPCMTSDRCSSPHSNDPQMTWCCIQKAVVRVMYVGVQVNEKPRNLAKVRKRIAELEAKKEKADASPDWICYIVRQTTN